MRVWGAGEGIGAHLSLFFSKSSVLSIIQILSSFSPVFVLFYHPRSLNFYEAGLTRGSAFFCISFY